MQKYNVYSRLRRVNLDDLDGMEVSELVPLIIELNILVQDLGKRLKSYGDNSLDELDKACGNADARRIFSCVDEFINHDGNVFKDDYYKNKLREKLTAFMFEALNAARNMAVSENAEAAAMTDSAKSENAAAVKLTQVLSELDDAEQETEAANFAKKKAVAELDCEKSENEKLKAAIKICGGTCMHMIEQLKESLAEARTEIERLNKKLRLLLCEEHFEKCERGLFNSENPDDEPCLICLMNATERGGGL